MVHSIMLYLTTNERNKRQLIVVKMFMLRVFVFRFYTSRAIYAYKLCLFEFFKAPHWMHSISSSFFLCRNIFILIRFIVTTKPSLRFFQLLKIKRVCAICLYCSEYMVKRMNANNYNWFKSVCNLIKFFIENRRTQYVISLWIVQKQN